MTGTFSVILPTRNRLALLTHAVQSVLRQRAGLGELIVVDDGSSDGTVSYLESLHSHPRFRFILQSHHGPAAARNAGIDAAREEFIAFTDDDCVVPPDWLESLHKVFSETGADVVGGRVHNGLPENVYAEVSQVTINHLSEKINQNETSQKFFTSNNVAYRSSMLKRMGGFDERFRWAGGEERALHLKLSKGGAKMVFAPDIVVTHYHAMTFSGFLRQQYNYGKGSWLLHRVIAKEIGRDSPGLSVFLLGELLNRLFRQRGLKGLQYASVFLLGQIAVLGGSLARLMKRLSASVMH